LGLTSIPHVTQILLPRLCEVGTGSFACRWLDVPLAARVVVDARRTAVLVELPVTFAAAVIKLAFRTVSVIDLSACLKFWA